MKLTLNDRALTLDDAAIAPEMPLLWVLRDVLDLTGTKYGCGIGACGACTVHVDGQAQRSCVTPVSAVAGRNVRTIEALGSERSPHAVQRAWIEHQVPQCGYCQSGLLMAAAALLARNRNPSDADIDAAINNLCRCGSTVRVRQAVRSAALGQRGGAAAKPGSKPDSKPDKPGAKPAANAPAKPGSAPAKPGSAPAMPGSAPTRPSPDASPKDAG